MSNCHDIFVWPIFYAFDRDFHCSHGARCRKIMQTMPIVWMTWHICDNILFNHTSLKSFFAIKLSIIWWKKKYTYIHI